MSSVTIFFRTFSIPKIFKVFTRLGLPGFVNRHYADTPKADSKNSKLVVVQGAQNEGKMRVRRALVSDIPRILRFIRENVRSMYPSFSTPTGAVNLVLGDHVSRALAQGHTLLAEQPDAQRWVQIRGLALSTAVCPWDAAILEAWSRCVRCTRSRQLISLSAHCLQAPALHDKYRIQKILQVILIVPQNASQTSEVVTVLAKSAIKRGREAGFRLVRFDVYNDFVSKSLEPLNLKKEWQLSYEDLPNLMQQHGHCVKSLDTLRSSENDPIERNFVTVYTSSTESSK